MCRGDGSSLAVFFCSNCRDAWVYSLASLMTKAGAANGTIRMEKRMGKRLYVGSLPYDTTEDQIRDMFAGVGKVETAQLVIDKFTGRSKGFAFVEMSTDEEAKAAVEKLNGSPVGSRTMVVNEAHPQKERTGGFGGGGGRGGFGGGRGGFGGGGGGGGRGDRGGRGGFGGGGGRGGRGDY